MWNLRQSTIQDVPAMLEIYRPYVDNTTVSFEYDTPTLPEFSARWQSITARFPWYAVTAQNSEVLGYAYADKPFERAAFQWDAELSVYLREDCRGQGIGSTLYHRLEDDLTAMGYYTAYTLVTHENTASLRFHEAMGYRLRAVLPDTGFKHGHWLSLCWYEKSLAPKPDKPNPPRPYRP